MDKCRAAIYIRVATSDQAAIDTQKERVLRFAAEQDIHNPACYSDNGCSGLSPGRPGFSRLQADIFAGKIQTVIAMDETRIGRDLLITGRWMDGMEQRGVRALFLNAHDYSREDEIRKQIEAAWEKYRERSRKSFAKK